MKTKIFKPFLCVLLLASSFFAVGEASAFEYPDPFTITSLFVSGGTNLHFRIYSNNPTAWLCSGGPMYPAWGYINETDDGARGKITSLQLAYALGKTVKVTTEGIAVPGGILCHILEFSVQ